MHTKLPRAYRDTDNTPLIFNIFRQNIMSFLTGLSPIFADVSFISNIEGKSVNFGVHSKPIRTTHSLGFLFNLQAEEWPPNHAREARVEGQKHKKKNMILQTCLKRTGVHFPRSLSLSSFSCFASSPDVADKLRLSDFAA